MYGEKYEEYANYTDIRDRIGTVIKDQTLRGDHKEFSNQQETIVSCCLLISLFFVTLFPRNTPNCNQS